MLFRKKKTPKPRPIFGFPCDTRLSDLVRDLHNELTLPIYPVAEHCLGLGSDQVLADLRQEDTRQSCYNHILEEHFLRPLFDANNQYDLDAAIKIRKRQQAHWELDRFVRGLVYVVEREGVPLRLVAGVMRRLVGEARQKRRHES